MKITTQHMMHLERIVTDTLRAADCKPESWTRYYVNSGFSFKRARWDALWRTPAAERQALFDEMYTYMDDTHIDTALRHIFGHKR